ncbi:MAG: hypothetical protein ACLPZR_08820, partial [Solirubrobacteraceae bacterium]
RIVASDDIDSSQFMWFFAWWPYALLHGLNPFVTHVMFVPQGFNLTWSTAMPGPSMLLSPITLAFGPAVTWNVIQLASPALSAWTAFVLCRHVTGTTWPALVGGYVFGFSPYMLIHLTGGPQLALVALVPVFVWLVVRRAQDEISPRRFVVAMSLALTAQYLISSEVLATATLFGAIALVLAFALLPALRGELIQTSVLLICAYLPMAVLISPFLYFFFFGHHYPPGATHFSADVASYALPSPLMAVTRHQPAFRGSNTEGYLGLGLVALIVTFMWQQRRSRVAWLVTVPLVVAALLALGSHLVVRGDHTSLPGPWLLLAHLPVLRYAIPARLALFVDLPAALLVAMFLARPGRWRWGLAVIAVALIVPDVGNVAWNTPIRDPAFFADGAYRTYLKPREHVLTVPAWGPNGRWQADTDFYFDLADGYAGNPFPSSYTRFAAWNTLLTGQLTPGWRAALRRFVAAKGVTAIVVDETAPGPWTELFGSLGVRPVSIGGVLVYRLDGRSAGS